MPDANDNNKRPPEPPRWLAWALTALLALLWFGNLQLRALTDPDEGRYAEIPREMLASGDWLAPHLNGIQYLEKPPLQYWGTAALYQLLGVSPWVSRLYTAGAGFGLMLLVAWAGRRFFGPTAGVYAGLVLGSGLLFYALAHVNTLDMGLAFYLNAAIIAFLAAQATQLTPAAARWRLWLAWLFIGLAVLQKGLVALVLPGFALGLYMLLQREWALLRRLQLPLGLGIVLAVNLPWWWLMARRNPGFVDFFFVHEHWERFTTTTHGRSQPWWYFGALLLVGLLPWLAPVARGVLGGWRSPRAPEFRVHVERFLVLWAAAVFIFYSPSGSKLAPYILPMLPPLALLAGRFFTRRPASFPALRSSLVLAALMGIGLVSLPLINSRLAVDAVHAAGYAEIARLGVLAGSLLLFATLLSAWLARLRSRLSAVAVLATGLIFSLALFTHGSNELERWKGGTRLADDVRPHLRDDAQLFCLDTYPQVAIFMLARTCQIAGDFGELETQFDDGERNWLRSDEEFRAAWAAAPRAVAIIDPRSAARWRALVPDAQLVADQPYAQVIVKQP